MEQDEASTYRRTPSALQSRASATVASVFISWLARGLYSAVGSLDRPPTLTTASTPSSTRGDTPRMSASTSSTRPRTARRPASPK